MENPRPPVKTDSLELIFAEWKKRYIDEPDLFLEEMDDDYAKESAKYFRDMAHDLGLKITIAKVA